MHASFQRVVALDREKGFTPDGGTTSSIYASILLSRSIMRRKMPPLFMLPGF